MAFKMKGFPMQQTSALKQKVKVLVAEQLLMLVLTRVRNYLKKLKA